MTSATYTDTCPVCASSVETTQAIAIGPNTVLMECPCGQQAEITFTLVSLDPLVIEDLMTRRPLGVIRIGGTS